MPARHPLSLRYGEQEGPKRFSHPKLNDLTRDLRLSKQDVEMPTSRLKEMSQLEDDVNVKFYQRRENISLKKINAGVFDGLQIKRLLSDEIILITMNEIKEVARSGFKAVVIEEMIFTKSLSKICLKAMNLWPTTCRVDWTKSLIISVYIVMNKASDSIKTCK
ncbi:hypothetical protein LAZ67_1002914 [Cordylochernes scorpioides]|uniref:Uncharacterized protein n=1 Tax=Cordylochernes scorpioides TaxID=51811 RepID=A0ABY6JXV5_9ARAC|nr:hypothetical protein LAZ67_1002914 [Cordylochernes scorpioides]